jgi:hypothetical protein
LALLVAMMSSKLMPKRASKLKGAERAAIFSLLEIGKASGDEGKKRRRVK